MHLKEPADQHHLAKSAPGTEPRCPAHTHDLPLLLALLGLLAAPHGLAHPAGEQPALQAAEIPEYQTMATGVDEIRFEPVSIKVLVDAAVLGSDEVEVGELNMPVGHQGTAHDHGAIEIFYVVSGVMNHIVDGVPHRLEPGMVGIVRPGHPVAHQVIGDEPVKAVVIWAPGGEADRLRAASRAVPR